MPINGASNWLQECACTQQSITHTAHTHTLIGRACVGGGVLPDKWAYGNGTIYGLELAIEVI